MKIADAFSHKAIFQGQAMENLKKDHLLMDLHSHTKYSHDSRASIKDILKRAKSLGIGMAVTDHLQAKGAVEACRQKKVPVIPGIEILAKENKEIILYFYSARDLVDFYEKRVKNHKLAQKAPESVLRRSLLSVRCLVPMEDLVSYADDYNCVKCIPHPYAYLHRNSSKFFAKRKETLKKIECVEVINSTLRPGQNRKALRWATKMNKAYTAGSDAHMAKQLGRSLTAARVDTTGEFLDAIRKKHAIIFGNEMRRREALSNILAMNKVKRSKEWN